MILLKDIHIVASMALAIIALIIAAGLVYVNFADVNHLLVIHFDAHRGIDLFGQKISVYNILWSNLLLIIINFFLVTVFYSRARFMAYLLAYSTTSLSLLILAAIMVIISVN